VLHLSLTAIHKAWLYAYQLLQLGFYENRLYSYYICY